jgi:thiol:disulfide interchange protein
MKRMHRRTLLALAACFGLAPALADHQLPQKYDPARDAAADLRQAVTRAQAERKKVLVEVGGEWCTWCHILDKFIASHPQVRRALDEQYVVVKVNFSPQNKNEAVLSRWPKAAGYPHFYVLGATGELLVSQGTGELEQGDSYDEAKVLRFLRRFGGGPQAT